MGKMNWNIGKETRREDGGPALAQVERDGRGELRPAAAAGGPHLQELRGSLPHCFPRRQWRRHAWQDREEGRQGRGRQEEVSVVLVSACAGRNSHAWNLGRVEKKRSDG